MSRLGPALGFQGAGRQQATSKQHQAFEQDTGFLIDKVHLLSRESVDATLQGGDLEAGLVTCWHPQLPILAVATSAALVEYDALSGCRRNFVEVTGSPVKLRYTPDGSHIVLLTKERNLFSWSTATWRRRSLLVADAKYAERPLVSGLLALTGGQQPVVYYSPIGKPTLRTIHLAPPSVPKGARPEKDFLPGAKLRTDNKKPIVALAAHPTDRQVLFLLLVDGSLLVCGVGGGVMGTLCGVAVPFSATRERAQLHLVPHPTRPGAALVLVEAERSGLSVVSVPSRNEVRMLSTLSFGAGSTLCGAGLLHRSCLLVAAARHAGGNVGVQAWRLLGDSRGELSVLQTSAVPSTVWDALQGGAAAAGGASSLADVSGEVAIAGMLPHCPSGMLAFSTARHDDSGAGHFRLPLLQMLDGGDPHDGLGVPKCVPLHTGLSFWTAAGSPDGMVTKLRFPRYTHLINDGRLSSYDVTHGLLADHMALSPAGATGQERSLARVVKSAKQGLWLAVMRVRSAREGAPLSPGQFEFTAVPEGEAAIAAGQWFLPGRDAAFLGARDELAAVLSNSGGLVAVFESAKLAQPGAKALYAAEFKEGAVAALYPGPPSHLPAAPTPRPQPPEAGGGEENPSEDERFSGSDTDGEAEADMREWEEREARRLELPRRLTLLTADNKLCIADVSQGASAYSAQSRALPTRHALQLRPAEAVLQVAWQTLVEPGSNFHAGCEGADSALPCVAAVLTTERALILDPGLNVLVSAPIPGDIGCPASCLWVGPALLVSTSANQVVHVTWEGGVAHLASLLSGPPVALVAVLADRLVVAAKAPGPALLAGRTEVASRGFAVLPPMLAGWAGVAAAGVLPGGAPRARRELRTLLCSYDASQLPLAVLQQLAAAGFADAASAAAQRSEAAAVTPAQRAALAAAAGDWGPVVELVTSELEASEHHPNPPPKGTQLYHKLVSLARACVVHGRFKQARLLLEAAAAWNELLALCVFQGDFTALASYGRQGGRDVQALADQLAAVNENAFRRVTDAAFGGRPNTDDWRVQVAAMEAAAAGHKGGSGGVGPRGVQLDAHGGHMDDGSDDDDDDGGSVGMDADVAPAGRLPYMEGSLRVTTAAAAAGALPPPADAEDAEEGQPIQRLDLSTLEAYLGVAGAVVMKSAVGAAAATSGPATSGLAHGKARDSIDMGPGLSAGRAGGGSMGEAASTADSEADAALAAALAASRGETPAQAAARSAFGKESADDDDFFSSDEEESRPDADARSANSFATATSNRFRFNIRSADDTPRGGASGGGGSGSLRAAVQSLRIGGAAAAAGESAASKGPPATSAGPSPSKGALSTASSMSSVDTFASMLYFPTIAPPPPAAGKAGAAAGTPATPSATSDDPFAFILPGNAAAASAAVDKLPGPAPDPFAGLSGLKSLSDKQPAAAANARQAPPAAGPQPRPGGSAPLSSAVFAEPIRPQPQQVLPQSDLLAGWDQFESVFGGSSAATAAPGPLQPLPSSAAAPDVAAQARPTSPPAPAAMTGGGQPASAFPPRTLRKQHQDAINAFRSGQWAKAVDLLSQCLAGSAAADTEFRQQTTQQYAAAAMIQRAAAAPPAAAARLSRYAAALQLGAEQRAVTAAFAVEANMAAGNFGYAGDQLAWLVVQAAEGAVRGSGLEPGRLQEQLERCDRGGGRNAVLLADEDLESFAAIVGSCSGRGEVEELLSNLAQG